MIVSPCRNESGAANIQLFKSIEKAKRSFKLSVFFGTVGGKIRIKVAGTDGKSDAIINKFEKLRRYQNGRDVGKKIFDETYD